MVRRPFVLRTRTGLVTLVLGLALVVVIVLALVELDDATARDPEMLAGGLTTAAAVGERVRTLANPDCAETELLVGVTAVPEGATTGAPAFVTLAGLAVVPVATVEPAIAVAVIPPLSTVTPFASKMFAAAS